MTQAAGHHPTELDAVLARHGRDRLRLVQILREAQEIEGWIPPETVAAIARALIHNPSLVLADEPTASLDTERAYQVVETFAGLIHEQKRAGIMVTHDLRMCEC